MQKSISRLNDAVSRALAAGTIAALVLMVAAIVLALVHPEQLTDQVMPLASIPGALFQGSPMAFFSLGVLVLLATPVLRVFVLLIGFGSRAVRNQPRYWLFAVLALVVLSMLVASTILGLRR